ncbi:hypothetical protein B0T24DRAFT_127579 [Lasiosphaeria ovina]|uniref:Uncharacterized protein n=1 Tax=Lasiosphaeria ovina TaxID=92902 RepID=A0AAE0MY90_9PEZI|nr:hypothetical protein B0T24DRAFT_127579 [Lasiosphaeria ovina]
MASQFSPRLRKSPWRWEDRGQCQTPKTKQKSHVVVRSTVPGKPQGAGGERPQDKNSLWLKVSSISLGPESNKSDVVVVHFPFLAADDRGSPSPLILSATGQGPRYFRRPIRAFQKPRPRCPLFRSPTLKRSQHQATIWKPFFNARAYLEKVSNTLPLDKELSKAQRLVRPDLQHQSGRSPYLPKLLDLRFCIEYACMCNACTCKGVKFLARTR